MSETEEMLCYTFLVVAFIIINTSSINLLPYELDVVAKPLYNGVGERVKR